jgi:hypothetical protein
MFKKLIIAAISASFVVSAAFADSTNIGFRMSGATLAASGSETTDSGSVNNGGAAVNHEERNADFLMPSLFIERQVEIDTDISVSLGLDFVPISAAVATLNDQKATDAKIKAGNLITAYIQPTFSVNEMVSVYGKVGYSSGDLDITDINRQATTGGDTASTDVDVKRTLEGPVYGIGAQYSKAGGIFSFVRLEATRTDFDAINYTNSNGKIIKADAKMDLITLSIGKSF